MKFRLFVAMALLTGSAMFFREFKVERNRTLIPETVLQWMTHDSTHLRILPRSEASGHPVPSRAPTNWRVQTNCIQEACVLLENESVVAVEKLIAERFTGTALPESPGGYRLGRGVACGDYMTFGGEGAHIGTAVVAGERQNLRRQPVIFMPIEAAISYHVQVSFFPRRDGLWNLWGLLEN